MQLLYAFCMLQMKRSTFRKLAFVNSKLSKYNILASIENLGFFDCNKYYVSLRHVAYYCVKFWPILYIVQRVSRVTHQ